jgi:hypothetical protein
MEEAGIAVDMSTTENGKGGGGSFRAYSIRVSRLTLGGALEQNVPGVYGAFPESLEHGLGFRIGGLISHGFFRNYRVSFDFKTMKLYLRRRLMNGRTAGI